MRTGSFKEVATGLLGFGVGAFVSYLVGMGALYGLTVAVLHVFGAIRDHEPLGEGQSLAFKITWGVAVFLLAPAAAMAASLLLGGRRRAWVLLTAVGFYGLTVGLLLPILGYLNDCGVHVHFPPVGPMCND